MQKVRVHCATVCTLKQGRCVHTGPVRRARGFQEVDSLAQGLERTAHPLSVSAMEVAHRGYSNLG